MCLKQTSRFCIICFTIKLRTDRGVSMIFHNIVQCKKKKEYIKSSAYG